MKYRGSVFSAGARSVLLHTSVTWALTVEEQNRLIRNDNSMVRWISSVRLADKKPMSGLRDDLGIRSIENLLRRGRLRWYGHGKRMEEDMWQKRVLSLEVDGKYRGRPKKHWIENVKADIKALQINEHLITDRIAWRTAIKKNPP